MAEQEQPQSSTYRRTPEEKKMLAKRNRAVALSLAVFIVLIFTVTMLRLSGN
ncbi:hypothetical protein MNBD_ALPHA05-58 [hydrothermal vent metagenome]|uniref:Uncharacterized protein n=1 Tax=hydrothermal vent metagenome TaxID=652676 RepID=A0A3B0TII0_9ZZZZ